MTSFWRRHNQPSKLEDNPLFISAKTPQEIGRTDVVAAAIAIAVGMMLITNGSVVGRTILADMTLDSGEASLLTAFLLNLALYIFGWRRYRDLHEEMQERIEAEQRAHKLAITDPLTGFFNRRALVELSGELHEKAKNTGFSMALLMVDLDNFKRVNDMHGHLAGDFLLSSFADRIQSIAPSRAHLARIGGDEFAFAFTYNPNQPEEVIRFSESILQETERPFIWQDLALETTASIGISHLHEDRGNIDQLIHEADIALYQAKHNGKNEFCWFDEKMESDLRARIEMDTAIRKSIPRGEFVPFFEPQIDMQTGLLAGFEVLARWNHPQFSHVSASQFIDVAQENGHIGALSLSVMEQAFYTARDWDPSLTLSVNISPTQLLDEALAQRILQLLIKTGFPAERLEVEITESAIFENVDMARSIISSLKNQGIKIAYDDFGTGYSSITHLREIPFDRIKIDRSFVTTIPTEPANAQVVRGIMSLCKTLNLPVTVEGIENAEIHNCLMDMGDFRCQGWYYGKPKSAANTAKYLAEKHLLPSRRHTAMIGTVDKHDHDTPVKIAKSA